MSLESEFEQHCMECGKEWVCYPGEELLTQCPDCGCDDIDTMEV